MSPKGERKFKRREEILALEDLTIEEVFVEPWDCYVRIRTMPGKDRGVWEQKMLAQREAKSFENFRAELVIVTAVDETGEPLFDDVEALGKKSAAALTILFEAAQKLNKLTEQDVKELAKN
jgi:hypothetical protein